MTLSATAFTLKDNDTLQDSNGYTYKVVDSGRRVETEDFLTLTMLELEDLKGSVDLLDLSNPDTDLTGIDDRIVSFMAATRRDLTSLHRRIEDLEDQVDNRLSRLEGF